MVSQFIITVKIQKNCKNIDKLNFNYKYVNIFIGDHMNIIWNNNSKLLIITTILEFILSLYFLIYFGYVDRLNYIESTSLIISDLALLIQNIYTSTWWALIISFIILISILSITSIIYKKQEYHFISILIWCMLFILSLDFTKNFKFNLSNVLIFIPIILINIKAYFNQKSFVKASK